MQGNYRGYKGVTSGPQRDRAQWFTESDRLLFIHWSVSPFAGPALQSAAGTEGRPSPTNSSNSNKTHV